MHNVRTPKTVIAHDHNDFGWPAYSFFVGQSPIVFFLESSLDVFFSSGFVPTYYVLYIMHQLQFVSSGSAILILEIKI